MAEQANVRSIDAITDCRASLIKYIEAMRIALSEALSDVRRVQQWVSGTKKQEWTQRGKKCTQRLANARSDLERAMIARPDAHPSMFTDQKRAVSKAKRNIEECEYKLKQIAKWTRELEREGMLFRAGLQRLNRIIDGDLDRGVAWMAALLDHLANYVNTPAPTLPRSESIDQDAPGSHRRGGGLPDADEPEIGEDDEPAIKPN
jgi:hypothetical protein